MITSTQNALAGTDKAAIMVMLLAEEDASKILGSLTPEELRRLAGTMCAIGEIEPRAIADSIASFSRATENIGISEHGRVERVRNPAQWRSRRGQGGESDPPGHSGGPRDEYPSPGFAALA